MVLKRGPLFAGMTTYVVPMLALAWGQFDHESISAQQLVAMAGVLVMVGLVQSGTTRPEEEFEMQPEATANLVSTALGSASRVAAARGGDVCRGDRLGRPEYVKSPAT